MEKIVGQENLVKEISRIFKIFKASECQLRPHFSFSLVKAEAERASQFKQLCEACQLSFIEVNAAQLTREGTSGNSLSKVLSPLMQMGGKPTVVFVDEFDKLFYKW